MIKDLLFEVIDSTFLYFLIGNIANYILDFFSMTGVQCNLAYCRLSSGLNCLYHHKLKNLTFPEKTQSHHIMYLENIRLKSKIKMQ